MTLKYSKDRGHVRRTVACSCLLAATLGTALNAHAAGYLKAEGGIASLIHSGGYSQSLSPAYSPQVATGKDAVEDTAGPFVPGGAD